MERTELCENHAAGYCQIVAQAPHVHRRRNRPSRCLEDMTSVTRSQAAKESACSFDKLDKMNATTAKFTSWIVMIRNPKILIIRYWSNHQHKFVDVKRFQCVLASADPKQYMYGCVLHDYRSENAIDEALAKFEEGSVWKIFSRLNSGRIFEEEISASNVRGKIPCKSLEAIVSEKSSREPGGEKEEEEYLFVYELFAGTVKQGEHLIIISCVLDRAK